MTTSETPWGAFDLADRLRRSLRVSDIGVQEMADNLGVSRNTVSAWVNGRITPDTRSLQLWAVYTGAPLRWLETGEEPRPEMAGALRGLPRLDLNQRPSDYSNAQVKGTKYGPVLRVVGDRIAA